MTTNHDRPTSSPDQSSTWSLKGEIKKRRTEQIMRDLEARRTQTTKPAALPPSPYAAPRQESAPVNRTPQILPARAISSGESGRTAPFHRLPIAAVTAVLVFVVIFAGISLLPLTRNPATATTPTQQTLPLVSASDAVSYLKRVGLSILDMRTFAVPNANWRASEEIQFSTQRQDGMATFVILSYVSTSKAGADTFEITNGKKFNTWKWMSISNLLVLSSPDSAPSVTADVMNHLTYYLAGPSVAFLPTVTLQLPTLMPTASIPMANSNPPGNAATVPTGDSATQPPTFTPAAPRSPVEPTLVPTSTPYQAGVASATRTLRPSSTVRPPAMVSTVADGSTPTPIPPEMATLLPPPTVTAAGPLIQAQRDTILKFIDAVPSSIGPFTLQRQATSTNPYGAELVYLTLWKEQIAVSLFITGSAQDALDRYQAEVSALHGVQPVQLADAAVIVDASNQVLAESRFRNVVLVIYQAESANGPVSFTHEQLADLLKALNAAIPTLS